MLFMIPLLIIGADGTMISVVYGPVALRRGGASPVPRVACNYNINRTDGTMSVNGKDNQQRH
jgi:hypothetical protein